MCTFAIRAFRCATHTVSTSMCLKRVCDLRVIHTLHVVKLLLALVDSDALALMLSRYLFQTNQHALKPVLIFLAALKKAFRVQNSKYRVEITLLLYNLFQNNIKQANEMRRK